MENKDKNKTFNLAIEYLGNCNSTENNSWHAGDWHPANRREASLTQEGDEGGEGRAEGGQQQESGGELQACSRLTLTARVLVPRWMQFHVYLLRTIQGCGGLSSSS